MKRMSMKQIIEPKIRPGCSADHPPEIDGPRVEKHNLDVK